MPGNHTSVCRTVCAAACWSLTGFHAFITSMHMHIHTHAYVSLVRLQLHSYEIISYYSSAHAIVNMHMTDGVTVWELLEFTGTHGQLQRYSCAQPGSSRRSTRARSPRLSWTSPRPDALDMHTYKHTCASSWRVQHYYPGQHMCEPSMHKTSALQR